MATKRLFIGTFAHRDIFNVLLPEIKDSFRSACFGKWVEPENLHFTYKFFGDVDVNLIPDIKENLKITLKHFDSVMNFKGLGTFPNPGNPRVLWAGIDNPDGILIRQAKEIDNKMKELGFPREDKKFSPHLTLIRIKDFNKDKFKKALDAYKDIEFGSMSGFDIVLIESTLTPAGPIYKII